MLKDYFELTDNGVIIFLVREILYHNNELMKREFGKHAFDILSIKGLKRDNIGYGTIIFDDEEFHIGNEAFDGICSILSESREDMFGCDPDFGDDSKIMQKVNSVKRESVDLDEMIDFFKYSPTKQVGCVDYCEMYEWLVELRDKRKPFMTL